MLYSWKGQLHGSLPPPLHHTTIPARRRRWGETRPLRGGSCSLFWLILSLHVLLPLQRQNTADGCVQYVRCVGKGCHPRRSPPSAPVEQRRPLTPSRGRDSRGVAGGYRR